MTTTNATSAGLRIALVSPYEWPPREEVSRHVLLDSEELARRGHRVTILAPSRDPRALTDGRAVRTALLAGDLEAAAPDSGAPPRSVALGRARPAGTRRSVTAPLDFSSGLEAVLSAAPFDIVHLHEPLALSPALAALRHARGTTAVTFHRTSTLNGAALLRPLVERALARVDLRIALSTPAARAIAEVFPGEYAIIEPGIDPSLVGKPTAMGAAPDILIVARDRDRAGVRFALRVLAKAAPTLGRVTVLGPPEAPWRTRAAVPSALRQRVHVIVDDGLDARAEALTHAGIVLIPAPADAEGDLLRAALARGATVLAARCPEAEALITGDKDGRLLSAFSHDQWQAALTSAVSGLPQVGHATKEARQAQSWSTSTEALERHYHEAIARSGERPGGPSILCDLGVWLAPDQDPEALVAAASARGLGAIALIALGDLDRAVVAAQNAPPNVLVIPSQKVMTSEGMLIGMFVREGLGPSDTLRSAAEAIHAQGGVVVAPHPDLPGAPTPERVRAATGQIDCHFLVTGSLSQADEDAIALTRSIGAVVIGGSGARRPEEVGALTLRMGSFRDGSSLLAALPDAQIVRRRFGRRLRQDLPS